MSLRIRLTLLLSLVVAVSLLLAWTFTRRAFRPVTEEMIGRHLTAVHFVYDELQKGGDAAELGRRLGFRIHVQDRPPRLVRRMNDPGPHSGRSDRRQHEGLEMFFCFGPRAPVAVKMDRQWLVVTRDFDVQAPSRNIGYW